MKRFVLSTLLVVAIAVASFAQTFPESVDMPSDFVVQDILMPQSPLSTQILFVGGADLVQTTPTYGYEATETHAKEWHDFIGFTPDDSKGGLGWVSVNHEMIFADNRIGDGGGNTVFYVKRNTDGTLEVMDIEMETDLPSGTITRQGKFFNVDFVNTVGETGMNCGGITDPYTGRIWTAEEWFRTSEASLNNAANMRSPSSNRAYPKAPGASVNQGVRDTDSVTVNAPGFPFMDGTKLAKYESVNWMVELDPRTGKALRKQYNWGRQGFEGGTITEDGTVYLGVDATPAFWCKFVPEDNSDRNNIDYSKGKLYVHNNTAPAGQKWIEVPVTRDNMLNFLTVAGATGATQYNRIEWVALDTISGRVFWTETGSDNPTGGFSFGTSLGATHDPYHIARAAEQGANSPDDGYTNRYGAIWVYDPAIDSSYVWIKGGPETDNADGDAFGAGYPDKHLSNPDGLNVMYINNDEGGVTPFLVINEDLNGTSYNRVPAGVSNRTCEVYMLNLELGKQTQADLSTTWDNLIRITAIPEGAESTGAQPTSDGQSLLINSQHPNTDLPFPYNHSLTFAINGFGDLTVTNLQDPVIEETDAFMIYPNPTTREVFFNEVTDVAIYNSNGQRVRVIRNVNSVNVADLAAGVYYIMNKDGETKKLIVQ